MVKSTRTERLREKARLDIKYSKQSTLDSGDKNKKEETAKPGLVGAKKRIEIIEMNVLTRETELELKVDFRLHPTRTSFSHLTANLYFNEQKIDTMHLRIFQGPLATNVLEFSSVLDLAGIMGGATQSEG